MKSLFFITFLPLSFYITNTEARYSDIKWFDEEWFILFFVTIVISAFIGRRSDEFFKQRLISPQLLPFLYALILIVITLAFYVNSEGNSNYYLISKIVAIIVFSLIYSLFPQTGADEQKKKERFTLKILNDIKRQTCNIPQDILNQNEVQEAIFAYAFSSLVELHKKDPFQNKDTMYSTGHDIMNQLFEPDVAKSLFSQIREICEGDKFKALRISVASSKDFPEFIQANILLVWIEKHVESITGEKIRYGLAEK